MVPVSNLHGALWSRVGASSVMRLAEYLELDPILVLAMFRVPGRSLVEFLLDLREFLPPLLILLLLVSLPHVQAGKRQVCLPHSRTSLCSSPDELSRLWPAHRGQLPARSVATDGPATSTGTDLSPARAYANLQQVTLSVPFRLPLLIVYTQTVSSAT